MIDSHMQSKIKKFKARGHINLGSSFLETKEMAELCQITKQIYNSIPKEHPDSIKDKAGIVEGVLNLPLHNIRIGEIINNIVSQPSFNEFQKEILGTNCKIWDISFRRSKPGNTGLYLHQDGVGQVNMAITLDDNLEGLGATAVLSGSHLVPQSINQLKVEVPPAIVKLFSAFLAPLSGKVGDIVVFSNRIWHGRFENKSKTEHDVIFIGFFPDGYLYGKPWPQDLIKAFEGTTLGQLLACAEDVEYSIPSNCECRDSASIKYLDTHGYSIAIENVSYLMKIRHQKRLTFAVQSFILITPLVKLARSLLKFLRPA